MIIYLIRNLVNSKVYVGQTEKTLARRWSNHCAASEMGKSSHLCAALRKYGRESFAVSILQEVATKQEADEAENSWITELHSSDRRLGYNRSSGGESGNSGLKLPTASLKKTGRKASAETKLKMSITRKGRPLSPQHCEALRGRPCSDVTRQKIRERLTGIKRSPETCKKISAAKAGRQLSDAHRAKIAASMRAYRHSPKTVKLVAA